MPTRGDAGHEGCRTGRMQDKRDSGQVMQDRFDGGK